MMNYMSLAPPWAQALPQPPPAAGTYTKWIGRSRQHTVEAGGSWGRKINDGVTHDLRPSLGLRKERVGGEPTRKLNCGSGGRSERTVRQSCNVRRPPAWAPDGTQGAERNS